MRVYRSRYYIVQDVPGLSGFQRWNEREYRVLRGNNLRDRRLDIVAEFRFKGGLFRLEDGRLPEFQDTTRQQGFLYEHLDANGSALILTPERYQLTAFVA